MPTVVFIDGFAVMILPNDHRPPHVHVFRGAGRVRITIGDDKDRPRIMEAIDMPSRDIVKALDIVIDHQAKLSVAWRKIHG
ncbi:MAG: DUF4160 domain-containing protein [Candidatus Riflebacteria bacterium]|nr:DUF4160 domain-containing protein [Candidatus Riflebacteria bacterium]